MAFPHLVGNLSGWHFLILLLVILLLFGAPRLPQLAKSLGQSMKILKKEVQDMQDDSPATTQTPGANSAAAKTQDAKSEATKPEQSA